MTRLLDAASPGSSSATRTSVISAFHNAQPRPRAHVASSAASRVCYVVRLWPEKKVQAIAVSQAGSPTPETPKSITALSRP